MRRLLLGAMLLVSGTISLGLLALIAPVLAFAPRRRRERVASALLGREWSDVDSDDPGVDIDD